MGGPGIYTANAAAMWSCAAAPIAAPDGVLGVATPTETRYLACRRLAPAAVAALIGSDTIGGRLVVEDPYDAALVPADELVRVLRMPVMCRRAQVRRVSWSLGLESVNRDALDNGVAAGVPCPEWRR